MLTYVKNKLFNNKWMTVSLLIGNILLIAIAAASPLYSDAALQRMLQRDLNKQQEETLLNPGDVEFRIGFAEYGATKMDYSGLTTMRELAEEFADASPVPVASLETELFKTDVMAKHEAETASEYSGTLTIRIEGIEGYQDHLEVIAGDMPSGAFQDRTLEAVVSEKTLLRSGLFVGETLTLGRTVDAQNQPYKIRIVGVFKEKTAEDPFWVVHPEAQSNYVYVSPEAFKEAFVVTEGKKQAFNQTVYVTLDYGAMRGTEVDSLLALTRQYEEKAGEIATRAFSARYVETLENYQVQASRLTVTLIVLQVPVFLLLAAFIFMVSGQMLETDQNEISMIKSRGASRGQIMSIYTLQSLVIAVISLALAMPLAYLICQVVGSSNAFLEFVQRRRLSVRFSYLVALYALGAAVIGMLAMILPALRYSRVGIVDFKRAKHRQTRPLWQKLFLDVILLGISLYGLYSYRHQASFLASELSSGGSLDPLLYLCSSMFMLGSAMLFVRLFPWLVKLIFNLFKKWWSPGLYASFLRMLRSRGNQNFIMIFLVLTLSLGIFSSETARTINSNAEEQIRYQTGADLVLKEAWSSQQFASDDGTATKVYVEPDYHKYSEMTGAASYTKVYTSSGYRAGSGTKDVRGVTVMGILTKEFGETAYLKDDLLDGHWYNYLNAMSQDAKGVLVSTDFRDQLGLKLGDTITYQTTGKATLTGVIYGFVDYFPTMIPPEVADTVNNSGTSGTGAASGTAAGTAVTPQNTSGTPGSYFIIANLSYLQSKWGVEPYEVWVRNSGSSSQYIYDFAELTGTSYTTFIDTNELLVELKNDPIFQATNGILTVGFIVVLVLCSVGFLIYWILSIRSRQLQFGIFRAMGMTMREIISMLINEQVFLSLLSIAVGAGVGKLTSILFVPLIQTAYSTANQMIPLEVVSSSQDITRLYMVVAVVMVLCMVILARLIKRIKIAQALKLGED